MENEPNLTQFLPHQRTKSVPLESRWLSGLAGAASVTLDPFISSNPRIQKSNHPPKACAARIAFGRAEKNFQNPFQIRILPNFVPVIFNLSWEAGPPVFILASHFDGQPSLFPIFEMPLNLEIARGVNFGALKLEIKYMFLQIHRFAPVAPACGQ